MSISEQLEAAIDIKDLVSKYASIKKAWVNYKAVCPFPGHNEKTPSFVVSPAKQIAYCFGCHKGWGPIKFVMDIENCEFKDAIQILWSMTGIAVNTNFNTEKYEAAKNLYSLFRDAVNYYTQALWSYPEVKKYLFDRQISNETIEKFHFWYSDSGVGLYNYLQKKWYNDELIIASNIFLDIKSKKDKFINRIIFPLQNQRWDFIWLAGRILGKWEPKYLNSPASDIYDKSNILYGMFAARSHISQKDSIIVCEWYMDVIALQTAGFLNSVWVSGTALTDKHLQLIKRLTKKIYLCFDWDNAWEKATKASLDKMKNLGFEVRIITLPEWKDPDDIVKSEENFQDYIDNALSPIGYYIKKANVNTSSIDDKKNLLWELLEVIRSYSDNIEKDHYLKEIAKTLNINEHIIYDAFNKIRFTRNTQKEVKQAPDKITSQDIVIGQTLVNSSRLEFFRENLIFPEYLSDDLKKIFQHGTEVISEFPLEVKEKYKAISLKIEEDDSHASDYHVQEYLNKTARALNSDIFKIQSKVLKQRIDMGDDQAFLESVNLKNLAKKHWIK